MESGLNWRIGVECTETDEGDEIEQNRRINGESSELGDKWELGRIRGKMKMS